MTKNPRYQTLAITGMGVTPRTDHQAYAVRVLSPEGNDYIELRWSKRDKAFRLDASGPISIEPQQITGAVLLRVRKPPRKRKTSAA
jgi:hypothetical protein